MSGHDSKPILETLGAQLSPETFNVDANTVEVVWYTGAQVMRGGWFTDPYMLSFQMDDESADLSALNSGAAVLDSHQTWSLQSVIGAVVPGTARIEAGRGLATVQLSKRPELAGIVGDIKAGIIRKLSMGAMVHERQITKREGALDEHLATRWSVHELSFLGVPADDRTTTLSRESSTQAGDPAALKSAGKAETEQTMADRQEQIDAVKAARQAERERLAAIDEAASKLRIPLTDPKVAELRSGELEVEACRKVLIDLAAERADAVVTSTPVQVRMTRDEVETRRAGVAQAMLYRYRTDRYDLGRAESVHKMGPSGLVLCDAQEAQVILASARRFAAMDSIGMARESLVAAGLPREEAMQLAPWTVARVALGRETLAGMHSTSDFPLILADASGKALLAPYQSNPPSYRKFMRQVNLPNFMTRKALKLGEFGALPVVVEGGPYTYTTITEGRETWALAKRGFRFSVTFEALINDDVDAFTRVPGDLGEASISTELDVAYGLLTASAALSDGVDLYHSTHANVIAGGGPPTTASEVGATRALLYKQTGPGSRKIRIEPRFLVVPEALRTGAEQFVDRRMAPAQTSNVVPETLSGLEVVADSRLDDTSTQVWYMAAGPSQSGFEYGYLTGAIGPQLERQQTSDVDGVEFKVRLVFGAGVVDHRGSARNAGA